jgi:hypothetical protein
MILEITCVWNIPDLLTCLLDICLQVDPRTGSSKAVISADPPREDVNRFGLDYAPLVAWLDRLQLGRYAAVFVKEEVDFDALHCLKEQVHVSFDSLPIHFKCIHRSGYIYVFRQSLECDIEGQVLQFTLAVSTALHGSVTCSPESLNLCLLA